MIYLDYAATHVPDEASLTEAQQMYFSHFANTSGRSVFSQQTKKIFELCRDSLVELLCPEGSLLFTSSASEANAVALWAMYNHMLKKKERVTIVTSPFEHPSITETLKRFSLADIHYLPANNQGIDIDKSREYFASVTPDILVVMAAHNETGMYTDLSALVSLWPEEVLPEIQILCDAAQFLPKVHTNTMIELGHVSYFARYSQLNILFTAAGHKLGAGFGAGILFSPQPKIFAKYENLVPYAGGSQEYGLRPGSHNLAAAYAFVTVLKKRIADERLIPLLFETTKQFETGLLQNIAPVSSNGIIIGQQAQRLPGVTMLCLPDAQIDFLLMGLDSAKIICSTGTSCKSGSRTASPGLLALGYSTEQALSVIRFSYGIEFEAEQQQKVIDTLLKLLPSVKK